MPQDKKANSSNTCLNWIKLARPGWVRELDGGWAPVSEDQAADAAADSAGRDSSLKRKNPSY